MHDQADQLRKLAGAAVQVDAALAPGGPIVALSGGQSGVGVTTIASQLARELARLGKQVVLIDANLQRTAAAKQINAALDARAANSPDQVRQDKADPRRRVRQDEANPLRRTWSGLNGTLSDVLTGARRAIEVLSPTNEDGVRLLHGCSPDATPPVDREAIERFAAEVTALSRQADAVLIDAGHGMNAWIDRLWQLARQVLLVTTPDAASLLDSYAAVKLSQFHRLDGKVRLLVNRTHDESEAPPLARRFEETCRRFLIITPMSPAALPAFSRRDIAARTGATACPDEPFRRAVRLLAADLACDFRVSSLRLLRPKQPAAQALPQSNQEDKKFPTETKPASNSCR